MSKKKEKLTTKELLIILAKRLDGMSDGQLVWFAIAMTFTPIPGPSALVWGYLAHRKKVQFQRWLANRRVKNGEKEEQELEKRQIDYCEMPPPRPRVKEIPVAVPEDGDDAPRRFIIRPDSPYGPN